MRKASSCDGFRRPTGMPDVLHGGGSVDLRHGSLAIRVADQRLSIVMCLGRSIRVGEGG